MSRIQLLIGPRVPVGRRLGKEIFLGELPFESQNHHPSVNTRLSQRIGLTYRLFQINGVDTVHGRLVVPLRRCKIPSKVVGAGENQEQVFITASIGHLRRFRDSDEGKWLWCALVAFFSVRGAAGLSG